MLFSFTCVAICTTFQMHVGNSDVERDFPYTCVTSLLISKIAILLSYICVAACILFRTQIKLWTLFQNGVVLY